MVNFSIIKFQLLRPNNRLAGSMLVLIPEVPDEKGSYKLTLRNLQRKAAKVG